MGHALYDGEPLRLVTNKPVQHLLGNTVWLVTGEGTGTRQYSLGSVFHVAEIGDAEEADFKRFASGPGHVFEPPAPIKDFDWFPEVRRATAHFSLGVQEIKDAQVIAGLCKLAGDGGYDVAEAPSRIPQPQRGDGQ